MSGADPLEVVLTAGITVGFDVHVGNARALAAHLLRLPPFDAWGPAGLARALGLETPPAALESWLRADSDAPEPARDLIRALGPLYDPLRQRLAALSESEPQWRLCAQIGEFAIGVEAADRMVSALQAGRRPRLLCATPGGDVEFGALAVGGALQAECAEARRVMQALTRGSRGAPHAPWARHVQEAVERAAARAALLVRLAGRAAKNGRR